MDLQEFCDLIDFQANRCVLSYFGLKPYVNRKGKSILCCWFHFDIEGHDRYQAVELPAINPSNGEPIYMGEVGSPFMNYFTEGMEGFVLESIETPFPELDENFIVLIVAPSPEAMAKEHRMYNLHRDAVLRAELFEKD